jgi:hypothetical protein
MKLKYVFSIIVALTFMTSCVAAPPERTQMHDLKGLDLSGTLAEHYYNLGLEDGLVSANSEIPSHSNIDENLNQFSIDAIGKFTYEVVIGRFNSRPSAELALSLISSKEYGRKGIDQLVMREFFPFGRFRYSIVIYGFEDRDGANDYCNALRASSAYYCFVDLSAP